MQFDTISIKHNFDSTDLAGMAKDQADKFGRMDQLESEMKGVATGYKAKIEELKSGIKAVSVAINYGFEMRAIRCLLLNERPEGFRLSVRLDTGRIVKKRKLEQHERQMTLVTEPTEKAEPYVAIAMLPVDDENWAIEDCYQCPVVEEEFQELKTAGVSFIDYQAPVAQIEAAG